ncbi:MAG: hypothetical protein R3B13_20620 [Polyangiaceae bacterium]
MNRLTSATTFALLAALGCTSEVPLGDGTGGTAGAQTGGSGGAAAGAGGTAAAGGSAGSSGGAAGAGGTAGGGGSSGSAGSGGAATCVPTAVTGALTELVGDAAGLYAVAESGDTLYYAVASTKAATTLGSVKKDGTGQSKVYGSGDAPGYVPTVLETDATHLYWLAGGVQSHAYRRPLVGGPAEAINVNPIVGGSTALAATSNSVFWANGSTVYASPKSSPSPQVAYAVTPGRMTGISMASNGDDVVWVEWIDPNETIATEHILRKGSEKLAPAQTVLSFPTFHPTSVAVDATDVYYAQGGKGVSRIALTGGSPTTLHQGEIVSHISMDATNVYFLENAGDCRTLMAVPKAGGAAVALATGLPGSASGLEQGNNLDVDATDVFVGTFAGKIFKVSK